VRFPAQTSDDGLTKKEIGQSGPDCGGSMTSTSPSSPTPASGFRRWARRIAIGAAAMAALFAAVKFGVPPIAHAKLESSLTEALGRRTTIEAVEFDPFAIRFVIRRLVVAGAATGPPLLTFDALAADVSVATLWHRAPVLDALVMTRPVLSFGRDRDGRLTVEDLVARTTADSKGPMAKLSLNNIEIHDATVAFDDAPAGRTHRLDRLEIGIPFLSTLPYQAEITVTPRLEGNFNGAHFALNGRTVPFGKRRDGTLALDIDALPLAEYAGYWPKTPRMSLVGGLLTTRLALVFADDAAGERTLELRGNARVDQLAVSRRDGALLVAADRIAVSLDRVDLLGRAARVESLAVDGLRVDLKRFADGTLELAQPLFDSTGEVAQRGAPPPPPAAGTSSKPWTVAIAHASVQHGALAVTDESSGFRTALADVTFDATNLSTQKGRKAHMRVAFVSGDRVATFKAEADVDPVVPTLEGQLELTKFSLGLLFPYYKDALGVDVRKGSLDFAARFALGAGGDLTLTQGNGSIVDLTLAYPGSSQPFWRNPMIAATGVDVDVGARKVTLATLRSSGATIRLSRQRDGSLDFARIVKTSPTVATGKDERAWTLALGKFDVEGAALDVEDHEPEPTVKIALRDLAFTASNVSNAPGARSAMALRARVGPRGRIAFSGPVSTRPVAVSGKFDAAGLDLAALRPYVEPRVNATFTSATLAASGTVNVEIPEREPARYGWKGNLSVTDFAALDKPTASDLVRWKSVALDSVDVGNQPPRVNVGRISVEDYFARVIVYADGTLNLARLLAGSASRDADAGDTAVASAHRAASGDEWPLTIGRVELARGNVNLSDFFVRPNYAANLTDVGGSVTTMSAEQAGDVAISARVNGTAPVEIAGRVHPFAKDLTLDIAAKARDVDLPPLTPYAVKYAGYGIERGKLTFDVHYRVEKRTLSADNRLVLDQLTFTPQRVDSPTATKLPVLLAVALLKDARGVIDVQLPISGSLDDPQFSVGGLVVRVIVNLIAKAATAPFALLSAAFGKGEELSTISFTAGSAEADAEANRRLDTLGKALSDRPGLRLDIGGRADPAADREALRQAKVESALKREKMRVLVAEGMAPASPELVTIGGEERVRWLTAAYRASSIADRPRNVVGLLKDLPPAEMEQMLLADAKVDDDDLRRLANTRAGNVKEALAARGVAGERIFLTAPKLADDHAASPSSSTQPAAAMTASRVDLSLR